jgi:outer membrane protein, heavy metal efflux system
MRRTILILLLALVIIHDGGAQSTIEQVLQSVEQNNKAIQSNNQFWEATKLEYQIGLTPYDPSVQYDYMHGTPHSAGNQTDFSVTQAFDFPTSYFKKRQLAELQIKNADNEIKKFKQTVLLETKQVCLELIYYNKWNVELKSRQTEFDSLEKVYSVKLNRGDGNILDLNKIKLQLIQIKKDLLINEAKIDQLNNQLTAFNGGVKTVFIDTTYVAELELISLDQLKNEYKSADPLTQSLEQQFLIAQKQVEVSKSLFLPKWEAGYHYQGILGQTYSGVHMGITIPLWEKKNSVQLQKSRVALADFSTAQYNTQLNADLEQRYIKLTQLKITLEEYEKNLVTLNNFQFLQKALDAGEISILEYFMELNFYRNALESYWQTQKEYYMVLSELTKYKL